MRPIYRPQAHRGNKWPARDGEVSAGPGSHWTGLGLVWPPSNLRLKAVVAPTLTLGLANLATALPMCPVSAIMCHVSLCHVSVLSASNMDTMNSGTLVIVVRLSGKQLLNM